MRKVKGLRASDTHTTPPHARAHLVRGVERLEVELAECREWQAAAQLQRVIKEAAVGLGVADGKVDSVLVAQGALGRERAVEDEVAGRRVREHDGLLQLELVLREGARLVGA